MSHLLDELSALFRVGDPHSPICLSRYAPRHLRNHTTDRTYGTRNSPMLGPLHPIVCHRVDHERKHCKRSDSSSDNPGESSKQL